MRFRYIDVMGREQQLAGIEDLVAAVQDGRIHDYTMLFDTQTGVWGPAGNHDIVRAARVGDTQPLAGHAAYSGASSSGGDASPAPDPDSREGDDTGPERSGKASQSSKARESFIPPWLSYVGIYLLLFFATRDDASTLSEHLGIAFGLFLFLGVFALLVFGWFRGRRQLVPLMMFVFAILAALGSLSEPDVDLDEQQPATTTSSAANEQLRQTASPTPLTPAPEEARPRPVVTPGRTSGFAPSGSHPFGTSPETRRQLDNLKEIGSAILAGEDVPETTSSAPTSPDAKLVWVVSTGLADAQRAYTAIEAHYVRDTLSDAFLEPDYMAHASRYPEMGEIFAGTLQAAEEWRRVGHDSIRAAIRRRAIEAGFRVSSSFYREVMEGLERGYDQEWIDRLTEFAKAGLALHKFLVATEPRIQIDPETGMALFGDGDYERYMEVTERFDEALTALEEEIEARERKFQAYLEEMEKIVLR